MYDSHELVIIGYNQSTVIDNANKPTPITWMGSKNMLYGILKGLHDGHLKRNVILSL